MAFVSHSHRVGFATERAARTGGLVTRVVACGILSIVAALFATGRPFLAIWAAVALVAWLLILGSSRARDSLGE